MGPLLRGPTGAPQPRLGAQVQRPDHDGSVLGTASVQNLEGWVDDAILEDRRHAWSAEMDGGQPEA